MARKCSEECYFSSYLFHKENCFCLRFPHLQIRVLWKEHLLCINFLISTTKIFSPCGDLREAPRNAIFSTRLPSSQGEVMSPPWRPWGALTKTSPEINTTLRNFAGVDDRPRWKGEASQWESNPAFLPGSVGEDFCVDCGHDISQPGLWYRTGLSVDLETAVETSRQSSEWQQRAWADMDVWSLQIWEVKKKTQLSQNQDKKRVFY